MHGDPIHNALPHKMGGNHGMNQTSIDTVLHMECPHHALCAWNRELSTPIPSAWEGDHQAG